MAERVVLHIGLMKSGTTYLQGMLGANREILAGHGVLFPGPVWARQKSAVADLRQLASAKSGAWDELRDEVNPYPGTVVISVEHLAGMGPAQIATIASAFGEARVEAILTVRDLGRTIPAMWQEGAKNGRPIGWSDYLAAVEAHDDEHTGFWRRQRAAGILGRWADALGADNLSVVVVPAPGAAPRLLWDRFREAAGLPDGDWTDGPRGNESLGAASTVLMTRLNREVGDLERLDYRRLVKPLGKYVLGRNRDAEDRIGFEPPPWVHDEARRIRNRIARSGARVVGDLDELEPVATPGTDPAAISDAAERDAAVAALLELLRRDAAKPWREEYWEQRV